VLYWNTIAGKSDAEARDAVLAGFRDAKAFDEAGHEDATHLVLPFVSPTDVVMEVGCGLGRLLKWVAPVCKQVIGLDVSEEMLNKAAHRLAGVPNVQLKLIPLTLRLPVASRTVDFAYFYHVSEHLEREDAYTILTEIRRCLRSTGQALVQFALLSHPDNIQEFQKWARRGDPEGVRSRFYTEAEATDFLRMASLFPQLRLYIPGEFVVLVTPQDTRDLGQMPLVRWWGKLG
jgi:SAM-dependent methyltransferase